MTRPAEYNYYKAFLVFSEFSSVFMVYIKKKEVNETNKRVGYATDRKSSFLTLKWNLFSCNFKSYCMYFGILQG